LHTPDILAAAHMVKANTLGYQLTGENQFLEQARYWAWSGIPFVYLVNPTEKPVGVYSTIAVFGATQWRAPVWFGLPVQWCGLVYADALYTLARLDPQGIWKRVADGVTVSGMQQSWPEEDPAFKGLLPDSFALRDQRRNGPAINPATLQACAAHFFGPVPVYDFFCFTNSHLLVHAPGQISNPDESKGSVRFKIRPWESRSYYLLVNGVGPGPHLKINGKAVDLAVAHEFFPDQKRLIVQARGDADIEIRP
ncbi:MAG TPA: hypothetical protein VKY92_20010, partial [Verrucomicrobiae bacterium]|nr:hypothetical protein [Verrucomicrobiae bacterium]